MIPGFQTSFPGDGGGGGLSHIKVTGCSSYHLGAKNAVSVLRFRDFSFNMSIVVAFGGTF